ncbi:S-adenosyl-L-methionine-dependent methyltransferase [Xylariaceae sp. FL0255]|nr:S-adenosyl-L-methionine-dependent methyltransferase [Xylariaceae sp. FL0255]
MSVHVINFYWSLSNSDAWFGDGRESELLQFILHHPNVDEFRGNPQKILDAIDEFGRNRKYLMNIGAYKSKTVIELIKTRKSVVMVELGGYVGYSAIAFAEALRDIGGNVYYSLEKSVEFGEVIEKLVDLAGLAGIVKVVIVSSSDSLRRLHSNGVLAHIDLLFLDHVKSLYTDDLKICEELGLIGADSVLAAHNGEPTSPPLLALRRA